MQMGGSNIGTVAKGLVPKQHGREGRSERVGMAGGRERVLGLGRWRGEEGAGIR